MTLVYYEPDLFWLILPHSVQVLIGAFSEIKAHLDQNKEPHSATTVFLVDTSGEYNEEQQYLEILKRYTQEYWYVWHIGGIARVLAWQFVDHIVHIAPLLRLSNADTYRLGKILSDTQDTQYQLINQLRNLEPGFNVSHEDIVKQILVFCFEGEFEPFRIRDQVRATGGSRRRDFIINNSNPKSDFWRHMRSKGIEQILIDAKNYNGRLKYNDVANTLEYLTNPAFGNFIIIISRVGFTDYSRLIDAYLARKQVVIVLTDDDLIAMMHYKGQGKSPTAIVEEKYYEFLSMR
jgi:hypothetical protein